MGAITLADTASVLIKGNIFYPMKTIFNLSVTTCLLRISAGFASSGDKELIS